MNGDWAQGSPSVIVGTLTTELLLPHHAQRCVNSGWWPHVDVCANLVDFAQLRCWRNGLPFNATTPARNPEWLFHSIPHQNLIFRWLTLMHLCISLIKGILVPIPHTSQGISKLAGLHTNDGLHLEAVKDIKVVDLRSFYDKETHFLQKFPIGGTYLYSGSFIYFWVTRVVVGVTSR